MKFRVYRFYVGCHVYDVTADTPEAAHASLEAHGDMSEANEFLHEANEPSENLFFTEVYRYADADAEETEDEPAFVFNPACAKIWREHPAEG